jgi:hypothetical protein
MNAIIEVSDGMSIQRKSLRDLHLCAHTVISLPSRVLPDI